MISPPRQIVIGAKKKKKMDKGLRKRSEVNFGSGVTMELEKAFQEGVPFSLSY